MRLSGHRFNVSASAAAVTGLLIGAWGAWTGQQAYDRTAGRSGFARITIQKDFPEAEAVPGTFHAGTSAAGEQVHFKTPRDLIDYGPRIVVENVGGEPIGDVKVETWLVDYIVDEPGAAVGDDESSPDPGNRIDRRVYEMPFQLMPGRKAGISVHAGLISQILDLQRDRGVDRVYRGRFRIRCSPRVVGASKFDEPGDDEWSEVEFAWSSGGFSSKNCIEHLRDPEARSVDYPGAFDGR